MAVLPKAKSTELIEGPANKAQLAAAVYNAVVTLNLAMSAAAASGLIVEPGCNTVSCGDDSDFTYDAIVVRVCEHVTF